MDYRAIIVPAAQVDLRKLSDDLRRAAYVAIDELRSNPRCQGTKKLDGDIYRYRFRHYRVIYEVKDRERVIEIARVRHRRDVYRGI